MGGSQYEGNPLYDIARDCRRLDGVERGKELTKEEAERGWFPFQKDYARLLHSAHFRRLQGKTQLFPGAEDDFFRNRLTHSLEVAQIAAGIARFLNTSQIKSEFGDDAFVDVDLVQFAGLAHDLGHPPFGHNGEHALDELMAGFGGFEGNAQTLRILARLGEKLVRSTSSSHGMSHEFGFNLTYRTLASILKYDDRIAPVRSSDDKLIKGYYATEANVVEAIKENVAPGYKPKDDYDKFKTIECSIMDVADDIAYSTYDLEDALHAGFVTTIRLSTALANDVVAKGDIVKNINKALKKAGHDEMKGEDEAVVALKGLLELPEELKERQKASSGDILAHNPHIRSYFTAKLVGNLIGKVELKPNQDFPQLSWVRLKREAMIAVELLKRLNFELNIKSPQLAVAEFRGKEYVKQIFSAIEESDGYLLPLEWREKFRFAKREDITKSHRLICDYVSGMTDRHAAEFHGRLFGNGHSIFIPL